MSPQTTSQNTEHCVIWLGTAPVFKERNWSTAGSSVRVTAKDQKQLLVNVSDDLTHYKGTQDSYYLMNVEHVKEKSDKVPEIN